MSEKTTGYTLLITGILIMIFATIQIITVITGKATPIEFFSNKTDITNNSSNSLNPEDLLKQIQGGGNNSEFNVGQMPNVQLIDPKMLNDILNLTLYYFIMQFLLSLGFKLASLGTQLLRPIQVDMKNRTFQTAKNDGKNN